jgi:hypothetical protein
MSITQLGFGQFFGRTAELQGQLYRNNPSIPVSYRTKNTIEIAANNKTALLKLLANLKFTKKLTSKSVDLMYYNKVENYYYVGYFHGIYKTVIYIGKRKTYNNNIILFVTSNRK